MVDILIWILFGSVMIVALPLQLLGLPGTWFLAADVLLLRWLMGPGIIDYQTVFILFIMALIAEGLEFLAAVQGASSGPQIKGAVAASILGAIVGGLIGAPVLFGLGAIPGMALGAWLGVFLVALVGRVPPGTASVAASGAMVGRLKGTAFKMIVAVAMVAMIIVSLVL